MNPPDRDPRLDALRGLALLGILLINIESFLSGGPNPIGYLGPDAGSADRFAYFFLATFVLGKFMPLFGMLFGAGFSLLYDKLKSRFADPRRVYRRRLVFLLAFGLLHGSLLYFGDITQAYAVAGFVLLRHADSDSARLARATKFWWFVAAVWLLFAIVPLSGAPDTAREIVETIETQSVATATLGYFAQWPLRAELFAWQLQANLFGLPLVIALMLTGALAHRAGWLQDPTAPAWRWARGIGIGIGLPLALVFGAWSVRHADPVANLAMPAWIIVCQAASVVLSFAYAAIVLQSVPRALVKWLAPAGRMPLTNYLLQSVAMGVLLAGWGLGLGTRLGYAQLSVTAAAIFVVQVIASRAWLAIHAQGPLEALWRWWTYRGAAPRLDPSRVTN